MNPRIFQIVLIFLDLCAATTYIFEGNWRLTVYWIAAATLTYVVTF